MKLFLYYAKKIIATVRTRVLLFRRGVQREPGVVVVPGRARGSIFFDFSNPTLVHLGDQLFHVPIVQHLVARGAEVHVETRSLQKTFAILGAKIGAPEAAPGLVVSKNDVAPESLDRFPESTFLGIHYGILGTEERVAYAISRIVLRELETLGQEYGTADEVPYGLDLRVATPAEATWVPKVAAVDAGKGLIAWNGYLGSDHMAALTRMPELLEKLHALRAEGYRIVHLGSAAEKRDDANVYPFVDLDLRGEIPPDEAVPFMEMPQVAGVLSFDTFLTHAAAMASKKIWVVMKRRSDAELFKKRFVPCVPGREHLLVWSA
jgi:hypothetical protein